MMTLPASKGQTMPDGNTHALITTLAAPVAAITAYGLGASELDSAACAIGCLTGLVLTPDLDLPRGRGLWRLYWLPYEKISRHRGLSHAPVIGTLIRLAYVAPLLAAISIIWISIIRIILPASVVLWWAAGLVFADLLHIGADGI